MTDYVTSYDRMRAELINAHRIDEVKDIRDKAEALRKYAQQTGESLENRNMLAEIELRAIRRAGKLLIEMKENGEREGHGGNRKSNSSKTSLKLSDVGITYDQSSDWQAVAELPEDDFEQDIATAKAKKEELTIKHTTQKAKRAKKERKRQERREENRQKIETVPDPIQADARFATIVLDPPWDWGDEGDVDQLGRARPTYSTLSLNQLLELPVTNLADVDCHLYLWITNRSLPKGFALLEKWGFRYVTCLTWVKPWFGMGNYFRGQTEHILFGVKGSQPLKRKDVGTVFHAQRGPNGHSSKPTEFYDLVESCSPGPYLEMFSRNQRPGWCMWGENGIL